MKKLARIEFNGVEKLVEITEEFHTEERVMNEMAAIWLEGSTFTNPPEHLKGIPYIHWPKGALDEEEIDKVYEKMNKRFTKSLIKVIEKAFNVKVNKNAFFEESYQISEEEKSYGIVMYFVADDRLDFYELSCKPYKPKK